MKWSRKTKEFQFKPYYSDDRKFRVQMLYDRPAYNADNHPIMKKYFDLRLHNWDSDYSHKEFMTYKTQHKIKDCAWCLIDNKNNQLIEMFSTAKAAKLYAETI